MSKRYIEQMEEKEKKNKTGKGPAAFFISIFVSIIVVTVYFSLGSIFISLADFYTTYKMTGRTPDGPPYTTKFPYNNMFMKSESKSIIYRYMRWITESLITSFSNGRYILDMVFDYIGKIIINVHPVLNTIVLLTAPLVMGLIVFLSFFSGVINTVIGIFSNIGKVIPTGFEFLIMALPLLLPLIAYFFFIIYSAGTLSLTTGFVQAFMMMLFFTVMPLTRKNIRQNIKETLLNNQYIILFTVLAITTVHAFTMLDNNYGYGFLGMTLAALLTYIYMKVL